MRVSGYGFFLALMLLLGLTLPVHAEDDDGIQNNSQEMKVLDKGTIKQVLKSDMIMLDDDKRYRLENILVPPFEDPPALNELKQFIGTPVTVYSYHDPDPDEDHDPNYVPYAHIVTNRGVWIQQDMISKGVAWAFCTETSPQTVGVLKQSEEKARVDHMGFWNDPAYAIKTPENIKDFVNSYQIVEGKITGVSMKPSSGFVDFNFGKGKKRDFAVIFKDNDQFESLLNNPITGEKDNKDGMNQWKGRIVRVRGWVKDQGYGPVIEITRKEQLDVIVLSDD